MTSDVGAQVAKWRSWIEKDIRSDVVGMHFKRMIWREVQEMVAANPEVGEVPSAFWDFYGENYAAAQAIAVRRQADRDARTCSLARLIKEMQADAELLTRDYYVGLLDERTDSDLLVKRANSDFDRLAGSGDHLDPEIPARDFEVLQNDAHRLRIYVNEHVAHDMAEPTLPEMPTYADLHAAIDSVGEIFKKYAVTLTGGWWATLEPAIQGDWRAIFRVPWLSS
jgi:AbiU2